MANAAIICVGNELLNGNTIDTNSSWLASKLLTISIPTVHICTVGDVIEDIKSAIEYAASKANIILITGGLGPTDDDITRNAIAEFLHANLEYHPEIFERIKRYFAIRGTPMPERNKVQAYLPAGTVEIENILGTAPGILYEDDKKIIAAFPGVPAEMKQMFDNTILHKLEKFSTDESIVIKKVKCIGTGESTIADKLGNLMARDRNPQINCTVDCGIITLYIVSRSKNRTQAEKMASDDIQTINNILGSLIFGYDDQTLAEVVGRKLLEKKKTLATAESCTGGLIAKMITDLPGSSRYFLGGWITYSNESKISQLSVEQKLIEKFGAVSSEVAQAMAAGAKQKSGADFAIATTGIAGPTGGSEQKPVGLVYISVASPDGIYSEKYLFGPRDRDFIRHRTAQTALNLLRLNLDI